MVMRVRCTEVCWWGLGEVCSFSCCLKDEGLFEKVNCGVRIVTPTVQRSLGGSNLSKCGVGNTQKPATVFTLRTQLAGLGCDGSL